MGTSVTGGACVLGDVDGDHSKAALYIVGGSTNESSTQYSGLQRYSFLDRRWATIETVTRVTQHRKHHGAAYLNASSSILVYAGSQDGDINPSTHTFLIDTWPPYNVRAFSTPAPPVVDPTMLTWSDNRVAMIGGSPSNNQVFTFGSDDGWVDTGVSLMQPLPDRSVAQSALLSLVDGSKVLMTFDMSQSPNTVTRTVVLNPGGQQAQYAQMVGESLRSRRRDVLLSNFPEYNDSLAPTTVRNGAALAQNPNGLIVITGGNDQNPFSIFDALGNQWVDATNFIGQQAIPPVASPTSSVSIPTASASSTSAPTSGGSTARPTTILGAVLGSILGIAALLIFALLFLRWKKRKNNGTSKFSNDKARIGSGLSFGDHGTQPIRAAAEPMGHNLPDSTDAMTMVGGQGSHSRKASSISNRPRVAPQRASNVSIGPGMFSRDKSPPAISTPILHGDSAEIQERPLTSRVRLTQNPPGLDPVQSHRKNDSGWSTYFSGNTVVDVGDNRKVGASRNSRASSGSRGSYWPDPSAPVANLRAANPGLTDSNGNQLAKLMVRKGSPSIGHSGNYEGAQGTAITEGIPTTISNTDSVATSTSDYDLSQLHEIGKSIGTAYPISPSDGDYTWAFQDSSWSGPPHRLTRPPSSTYTSSIYPVNVTSPGVDWPKPSIRPVTQWPNEGRSVPTIFDSRPGSHRGTNPPVRPAHRGDEVRDYFGPNHTHQHSQNDMSWLNLQGNGVGEGNGNRHMNGNT